MTTCQHYHRLQQQELAPFGSGWRWRPGRPCHSWIQQIGDGTPFSIRAEWSKARRFLYIYISGLTQWTSAVYVIWWWWWSTRLYCTALYFNSQANIWYCWPEDRSINLGKLIWCTIMPALSQVAAARTGPLWFWLVATARTPLPFMDPADRRPYTLQHSCWMVQGSSLWTLWVDATDLCCLRDLMMMMINKTLLHCIVL